MKNNNKQPNKYVCAHCNKESEVVSVMQKEVYYYSFDLGTRQWKDFHGDESVELQEFFCINCKEKIDGPSGF